MLRYLRAFGPSILTETLGRNILAETFDRNIVRIVEYILCVMHTLQIQVGLPSLTRNIVFLVACFFFLFLMAAANTYYLLLKPLLNNFFFFVEQYALIWFSPMILIPISASNDSLALSSDYNLSCCSAKVRLFVRNFL